MRNIRTKNNQMINNITISIIVCTYNSEKTIERCLNSILLQTYKHYEIIVQDGFSDDDTCLIVSRKTNNQALVRSEKDTGIYDAFNKAILRTAGKYVIFLNSDDYFFSNDTLANLVLVAEASGADAVYGGVKFVNAKGLVIRDWRSSNISRFKLSLGIVPAHTGCLMLSSSLKKIGDFNVGFKISGDFDFMIRFFNEYLSNTVNVNFCVSVMQIGGASTAGIKAELVKLLEDYKILKVHTKFPLGLVVLKKISKIGQWVFWRKIAGLS